MQKRNREIEFIEEVVAKRNTKSKRTKYIINKAKELSILCNLKINISFYDPSINRVIEFASDPNFTMHEMVGRVNGDPLISPTITKVKHKLVTAEEIAVSDNIFKSEIDSNKNKIQKPKYLDEIEFAYISDTNPLLK